MYHLENFEENNSEFFNQLLKKIKEKNYLSPNLNEIIVTDDLAGEIYRYSLKKI